MDVLGRPIDECGPIGEQERASIHREAPAFDELSASTDLLETGIKVIDLICPFAKGGKVGDRKSTRLNSSHVRISYAGFCLKKKTVAGGLRKRPSRRLTIRCNGFRLKASKILKTKKMMTPTTATETPTSTCHIYPPDPLAYF